ncbi:MAG: inactive transglutaminase family protein [Congregibacter sp.]
MNNRASIWLIIGLLLVSGLATAMLRHSATGIPWLPGERTTVWQIEARVDFAALGGPVTASLSLPESVPGFRIIDEQSASAGYGYAVVRDEGERRGEWTRREATGLQSLYYSASFLPDDTPQNIEMDEAPSATPVFWSDAETTAASALIEQALASSSSARSLARELAASLAADSSDQNAALLRARNEDRVALLAKLLNDAEIPTRSVMALRLEDARRRQSLTPLLEVFDGEAWLLLDPTQGIIDAPDDLLLWHRSEGSVLDVIGGQQSRLSFSMIQQSVPAVQLATERDRSSLFTLLGVHRLPIEEQSMFKLLLLLPMGAMVVVLFRVLIGIQTAGTFMPVLIALVFLQTSLLPGLISFVSVILLGLLMRGYLSQLNLLLVARIAALIVVVIFIISILSIVGYQLGISTGMIITFFPMIIIAWTIERLSILWEEEGPRDVFLQGGGSLLVAVAAYLLMGAPLVQHLSFNFPELNLVLLAAILAMGQYTGYKLTELRRFAAMDDLS